MVIVDAMAADRADMLNVSPNIPDVSFSIANETGMWWYLEPNISKASIILGGQDTADNRQRAVAHYVAHQMFHSCLAEIKHNYAFPGDLQVQRRRWLAPFCLNSLFDFREEGKRNVNVFIVVSWSVLHSYILEPLDELITERKCRLANDKDINSQASVVIKNLLG